jgi:hypothetical protein
MTNQEAYLLGLMTGRGHLFKDNFMAAIEFSHANEFVDGIAHCEKCGYLATKPKNNDSLICKNEQCLSIVNPSIKKRYNQPVETLQSLKQVIIPFLKSAINAKFEISSNKAMTLLIVDFSENKDFFDSLVSSFYPFQSFDSFHIPEKIHQSSEEGKIEFVNGLLDTSGFANAGSWLNRDGEHGHGRMRGYFQIVRNWHMPVEIDNFLREYFQLPIQTIDWGHPNIRDGNLVEFCEGKSTSWSREHQIKFFPEYYEAFKFRISSKQSLFQELLQHNLKTVFTDRQDWFPPSKITYNQVKPSHPGEDDIRIPLPARKHVNAFWQINLLMGCKFLAQKKKNCHFPEMYELTAEDKPNFSEIAMSFIEKSLTLQAAILSKHAAKKKDVIANKPIKKIRTNPEAETYPPLVSFFGNYLSNKYSQHVETFDTSAGNLNAFLKNKATELLETFEDCERLRIRPDVVSFLSVEKKLVFIESKVTPLDLSALGQLIGYCLVAKPIEAILISTKEPTPTFIRVLKANKHLLEYESGKSVQIATLKSNGDVVFTGI